MRRIYLFLPLMLAASAAIARADCRESEDSRRLVSMMAHPSMEGRRS